MTDGPAPMKGLARKFQMKYGCSLEAIAWNQKLL